MGGYHAHSNTNSDTTVSSTSFSNSTTLTGDDDFVSVSLTDGQRIAVVIVHFLTFAVGAVSIWAFLYDFGATYLNALGLCKKDVPLIRRPILCCGGGVVAGLLDLLAMIFDLILVLGCMLHLDVEMLLELYLHLLHLVDLQHYFDYGGILVPIGVHYLVDLVGLVDSGHLWYHTNICLYEYRI